MALSLDWTNKLVLSTASITDIVAFKDELRAIEESDEGLLHDPIIAYKKVDLGGGAYFHDVPFINGYQLKFPNPGNYTVIGNIGATIVPVAGVFVDRTKSAAFATVAGEGGTGGASAADVWAYGTRTLTQSIPTAAEIAAAILAAAQVTPIHSDVRKVIGTAITGSGVPPTYDANGNLTDPGDPWVPS